MIKKVEAKEDYMIQIDKNDIYPFFPICSYPLFEAVLLADNKIDGLDYLYLNNSFFYEKNGLIENLDSELNISFGIDKKFHKEVFNSGENNLSGYLPDRLLKLYGVKILYKEHNNFNDFKDFIIQQLNKGIPVICEYNLMFTPTKVQYGKKSGFHSILITDYDFDKEEFNCVEAAVNPFFKIKLSDLEHCFKYHLDMNSNTKTYEVVKIENEKSDFKKVFFDDLSTICNEKNNTLNVLNLFISDLFYYLDNKKDTKGFTIKDLCSISLEKKTSIRYLEKCLQDISFSESDKEEVEELKNNISNLADLWVNVGFLLEKSLYMKEWKYTEKLKQKLTEIQELELENYKNWNKVKEVMECYI